MMPIKPENAARYPADWPAIRERIRARAGNRCENCGVPNRAMIYRDRNGWHEVGTPGRGYLQPVVSEEWATAQGFDLVRIVCTTAHLDHVPEHCEDDNLRFWCQRCHLAYDAKHHQQTAYATRRAGRAQDMFEDGDTAKKPGDRSPGAGFGD